MSCNLSTSVYFSMYVVILPNDDQNGLNMWKTNECTVCQQVYNNMQQYTVYLYL
jgi:hypothetical protein